MKEYAIWGKPPGQADETLLVAQPGGKPITDPEEAKRYMDVLIQKHGCTDCRIQTIDMENPDMSGFTRALEDIRKRAGMTTNWSPDTVSRGMKRISDDMVAILDELYGIEGADAERRQAIALVEEAGSKMAEARRALYPLMHRRAK